MIDATRKVRAFLRGLLEGQQQEQPLNFEFYKTNKGRDSVVAKKCTKSTDFVC